MKLNEILTEGPKQGPGAMMSDELAVGLAKANVPKEVIDALRVAMENASQNVYAQTYAHAMTLSFNEHGVEGVKMQVLYLLGNMGKWQGEEARNAKKILKKWASK